MAGGADDGADGAFSGINVTPLVDVMLVLLVIFMVTAPMMQQGVAVDLPNAAGAALPQEDTVIIVSVTVDGQLFLNDTKMDLGALTERLLAIREEKPLTVVYLRADNDASYGNVVSVMAALKRAGIEKLGMITETGDA
jgi:biopolymer transport protein TolR